MKKNLLMLIAIIASYHFMGCKKIIDQIHHNPGQDFQYCNIKKIKVWYRDTYNEFTVYYNKAGQPKDVLGKYPDSSFANNDQHFRYDTQGRLTDWLINPPGQQQTWMWNTYHYLSPTRILDTLYYCWNFNSYITDKHPPYDDPITQIRYLDFDSYGRIAKVTWPVDNSFVVIMYDGNGNASITPPGYDSAINIMRTNKIWMFVNSNYSMNNHTQLPWETIYYTYNSYRLPVTVTFSDGAEGPFMSAYEGNKITIEYDCAGSPKHY